MNELTRKEFLQTAGLAAASVLIARRASAFAPKALAIKAIAFDGFPVFDPRPILKVAETLFPGHGKPLVDLWMAKQFGYQWLRVAAGQYKDFPAIAKDALDVALEQAGLSATSGQKANLLGQYDLLNVWPDVVPSLRTLAAKGVKLGLLSNMTGTMLQRGIKNSGTKSLFDFVLSTDAKRTFKPSPVAYQMGVEALGLKKQEILFVAFAGWDVAGAKWFGYPTYWMNRAGAPIDRLDVTPDGIGKDLGDLLTFVDASGLPARHQHVLEDERRDRK